MLAGARPAAAHAGLRSADPTPGATLGASPTIVQLTLSENASPALSTVRVVDRAGASYAAGSPSAGADPKVVASRVRTMPRGVYLVDWRIVSAVDGHVTAGTYAFGIGEAPTAAAQTRTRSPSPSLREIAGRSMLLAGLALLLGIAVAAAAGFGDRVGGTAAQGASAASAIGLLVLADAQRTNASASWAALFDTSVGRALLWRGAAVASAGAALFVARRGPDRSRRFAMMAVALAVAVAMAVHVGAGHAAGRGSAVSVRTMSQWAHFAAAGVWFGGLVALLLFIRGAPSATRSAAARRYAAVAAAGIGVVAATGTWRAVNEVASWRELTSTGYGRAVVAKALLIAGIAAFAARNRWRSLPVLDTDLMPLRRTSRRELTLATAAVVVAALLGALAPPASARPAPPAITVAGSDVGTTTRVRLTVASAQPGPNRFMVRAVDYDSGTPVRAARVHLRFTPLDDADVVPSTLALSRQRDGTFAAVGTNLVFDGRWGVDVVVQRERDSATIPLQIESRVAQPEPAVVRPTDGPTSYAAEAQDVLVYVTLSRERPGLRRLTIALVDGFHDTQPLDRLVVTATDRRGRVRQQAVQRVDAGTFTAGVELRRGSNPVTVVAKTAAGVRRRAVFDLTLS
jgi:copper transport protein